MSFSILLSFPFGQPIDGTSTFGNGGELSVPAKDIPQLGQQEIDFSKLKTYEPQVLEKERLRLEQELLLQNNNYSLNIEQFQQQLETLPESSENRLVECMELILENADEGKWVSYFLSDESRYFRAPVSLWTDR